MDVVLLDEMYHFTDDGKLSLCGRRVGDRKLEKFTYGKNGVIWIGAIGVWLCRRCESVQQEGLTFDDVAVHPI